MQNEREYELYEKRDDFDNPDGIIRIHKNTLSREIESTYGIYLLAICRLH